MDNNHLKSAKEFELPVDSEARVIREARKEGVFAGLTCALASAILGGRLYSFNRNKSIMCGILSGVFSGYLFTQAFTSTAIAQLRAEEARQRKEVPEVEAVIHPKSSSKAA
ncbi:hypothetical protein Ac2012v2_000057 [Leucoagaricus gongylophorus]